jgi:AraC-like DNA-binding protein
MISSTIFPVHVLDSAEQPGSAFAMHKYLPGDRVQRADYPHRHDFYQVIHITEGRGQHLVDHQAFPITPPILFFVSAGQVHCWRIAEHLQGDGLLFRSDFLEPSPASTEFDKFALFHRLSYAPLKLDRKQSSWLQRIIELITHEHHTHNSATVLNAYLHILFTQIQRLCTAAQPVVTLDPATELVRRYRQLVSQNFMEHRSVQSYADLLGVSVGHLSRSIKDVTGHSASEIIRQELVMEAKRLLVNTDLAVERISDHLAFNDPAYFGRFFKRETGFSPGAYRSVIFEEHQIHHR